MANPYVPAVHMNLRYLCTSRAWFGGGADLTPDISVRGGHGGLSRGPARRPATATGRTPMPSTRPGATATSTCRTARSRAASAGSSSTTWPAADQAADFAFVRAVGEALLRVYPRIVARRKDTPFDEAAREKLLLKRGRYVEFNLVYDRGTKFGFSTDADPEAYLMSLPPVVKW